MVSQSDLLPMRTATRGFDSGMRETVGRLIRLRQQTQSSSFADLMDTVLQRGGQANSHSKSHFYRKARNTPS
jgi:hypothetical protein